MGNHTLEKNPSGKVMENCLEAVYTGGVCSNRILQMVAAYDGKGNYHFNFLFDIKKNYRGRRFSVLISILCDAIQIGKGVFEYMFFLPMDPDLYLMPVDDGTPRIA